MRIAVVTPYYQEPIEKLQRCHESVLRQTHSDVIHIMVADGFARPEIDAWERCLHIALPIGHADSGDTPRVVGCSSAAAQRYDAIALLDADNWFEPEHLETLVRVQAASQAPIVTCARTLRRPDTGECLGVCTESDGVRFNDANCYLITDPAYRVLAAWGFRDKQTAEGIANMGDRLFWHAVVQSQIGRAHSRKATVNYETAYAAHYWGLGLAIPDFAKVIVRLEHEKRMKLVPYAEYRELLDQGLVAAQGF